MPNQEAPRFSRRTFLRGSVVAGAAAFVASCTNEPLPSWATYTRPPNAPTAIASPSASVKASLLGEKDFSLEAFKQEVAAFTYDQSKDGNKLKLFLDRTVQAYSTLTGSKLFSGDGFHISLTSDRGTFEAEAASVDSGAKDLNMFFVDPETRRIIIDRDRVLEYTAKYEADFGIGLVDTVWNAFLIFDRKPRSEGEMIDNPQFITSKGEKWTQYFGGMIFAGEEAGFQMYDWALREAVAVGLSIEITGGGLMSHEAIFQRTRAILQLVENAGMDYEELYGIYSTSNWDKAARTFGGLVRNGGNPLIDGYNLIAAIDTPPKSSK